MLKKKCFYYHAFRRFICLMLTGMVFTSANGSVTLDSSNVLDKIKGCWLGQIAGVDWGAPVEQSFCGAIMPENSIPVWSPGMINTSYTQDDIYCENAWIKAMRDSGVNCNWHVFGQYWVQTTFQLWCGNDAARHNIWSGMAVPTAANYLNDPDWFETLDFEIEADWCGLVCPAQIQSATDLGWRAGHVIGYSDGVYGGVIVAAMHAKAFTATTLDEIIQAGRQVLPVGCKTRSVVDDVLLWKSQGLPWDSTWTRLHNKYYYSPTNNGQAKCIDGALCIGDVFIGLLYGNGDFEQSVRLTVKCSDDNDCTASTCGGILGAWLGYAKIPDKFKSAMDPDAILQANEFTFNQVTNLTFSLAKKVTLFNGGTISQGQWTIPDQGPIIPLILEMKPNTANAMPVVTATATPASGGMVNFTASASDADGIQAYQWFYGDLSYGDSANTTHHYLANGTYTAICYTADRTGNTGYKEISVNVTNATGASGTTTMVLSPASLTFAATHGATSPAAQTLQIANSGSGTLNTVSTGISYTSGSGWLTVAAGGSGNAQTLINTVALGSLAFGSYVATVTVACANAQPTTATYSVAFQVTAPISVTPGVVTWGSPAYVKDSTDVVKTGTLKYAYVWIGTDRTLNSVPFKGTGSATNVGTSPYDLTIAPVSGSVAPGVDQMAFRVPDGVTGTYGNMLQAGLFVDYADKYTITLNNLTSGHNYQIQIWSCDAYYDGGNTTITCGDSVVLDKSKVNGLGAGQYVIGTFTAGATAPKLTFSGTQGGSGDKGPVINALQVRENGTTGVIAPKGNIVAAGANLQNAQNARIYDVRGRMIGISPNGKLPQNARSGIYLLKSADASVKIVKQ
ncbi:MAG: ADP-ribosylglycohydrolase family protein [Chitinivibrionales bacterium]|nr:ADP-ribosylglycohydrolase family protein [Chitinivibrionales bacterium]